MRNILTTLSITGLLGLTACAQDDKIRSRDLILTHGNDICIVEPLKGIKDAYYFTTNSYVRLEDGVAVAESAAAIDLNGDGQLDEVVIFEGIKQPLTQDCAITRLPKLLPQDSLTHLTAPWQLYAEQHWRVPSKQLSAEEYSRQVAPFNAKYQQAKNRFDRRVDDAILQKELQKIKQAYIDEFRGIENK